MTFQELYLSLDGRISRRTFWIRGFLPLTLLSLGFWLVDGFIEADGILELIGAILLLWPSLAINVKRWHDRGKSGWWVLVGLIPIAGPIWALVETGFLPGDAGPNAYGTGEQYDPSGYQVFQS